MVLTVILLSVETAWHRTNIIFLHGMSGVAAFAIVSVFEIFCADNQ